MIGMDFDKFERQMKFAFLDVASLTKDGIQDTVEEILATIRTINLQEDNSRFIFGNLLELI